MRVKRFVANSMKEAIALVKADFGPEAVILHTKRSRRGGIFHLFGKPKVEVIAALDPPVGRRQPSRPVTRIKDVDRSPGPVLTKEDAAASELAVMRRELEEIKSTLQHNWKPVLAAGLEEMREYLEKQDIHKDLIQELLVAVQSRGSEEQLQKSDWVKQEIHKELSAGIPCGDPWSLGDGAKIQCLIGPTGVGKTTTIAKLAANYSLLGKKKVALITVDTYRIAAVEQLKTYAEIIGVPVDVALTPQQLKEAVDRRQDHDLILIDTAGRSQKNQMQMAELRAFVEVIESPQIHLVLSATTRLNDMINLVEQFGTLRIAYTIVTKLDETSSYGMLYNLCRLGGAPLSYVTNGQNVPDDIEVAAAERIADLILGVQG